MIRQLRKRFIRITMLSVSVVMLILTLIVNAANFISTNADLEDLLDMICENRGSIPTDRFTPDAKPDKPADSVDSSDLEPTGTTPPALPAVQMYPHPYFEAHRAEIPPASVHRRTRRNLSHVRTLRAHHPAIIRHRYRRPAPM